MEGYRKIVVIGGGVVGCSVAYHLAKRGWTDVLLLERETLTSGSSWHAAGSFHTLNSDTNIIQLQNYTIDLYKQIEEESGQSIGLHITGGVVMACTQERMNHLRMFVDKGSYMDMNLRVVTPQEAKRDQPLLDAEKFVGGIYDPREGHLDPAGATIAYSKAAKKLGVEVIEHSRVKEINRLASGEWEIVADKGTVRAEHVVNAAGLWAREVGQMTGLQLPVLAMEHQYLITEDLPDVVEYNQREGREILHLIDPDGEIYMRQERNGVLLGTYEQACVPWSKDSTPWDFTHELLPDDMARISPSLEVGFGHLPALADAGIRKVVNGPFTFTPDGNPLVGQVKELRNYWCACGVMAGFSQGGGVGLVLANWMIDGDPGFDIWGMDVSRFGDWVTPKYTADTVRQFYQRRFSVSYPNEELPAGRNMRKVPVHDELVVRGANFGVAYGVENPNWYAADGTKPVETPSFNRSEAFGFIGEEVEAVRHKVGMMEISTFAKYRVTGPDAAEWLSQVMANRLPEQGRIRLTTMLDDAGRVIGDFTMANRGGGEFLVWGSGLAENYHLRWFARQRRSSSVDVEALGLGMVGLAVSGPESRKLLAQIAEDPKQIEDLRFFGMDRIRLGGAEATVCRISYTGELGYELWMKPEDQPRLFAALMEAGEPMGLHLYGSRALQSLRMEKGFGSWATEYRPIYTPIESGLQRLIAADKESFVGKEAYLAAKDRTPERRLVSIAIDGTQIDAVGDEPLYLSGKAVGWVTSGSYGHHLGKSLALGYVPHDLPDPGDGLEIEIIGKRYPASISGAGLYDPKGERMRA